MADEQLDKIEGLPKSMLSASDISAYLETDPNIIRWQAQNEPDKLGFPVIVMRSRVKIPKAGFVHYCRYGRVLMTLETRIAPIDND